MSPYQVQSRQTMQASRFQLDMAQSESMNHSFIIANADMVVVEKILGPLEIQYVEIPHTPI